MRFDQLTGFFSDNISVPRINIALLRSAEHTSHAARKTTETPQEMVQLVTAVPI